MYVAVLMTEIICGPIQASLHAQHNVSGYTYLSTVKYQCVPGYKVAPSGGAEPVFMSKCLYNGAWSEVNFTCAGSRHTYPYKCYLREIKTFNGKPRDKITNKKILFTRDLFIRCIHEAVF